MTLSPGGRTASSADTTGDRVEMTVFPDGQIGLRDSTCPETGYLTFTRTTTAARIQGAQAGEFDDLR